MSDGAVAIAATAGKDRTAGAARPGGKAVAIAESAGRRKQRKNGEPISDRSPGVIGNLPILIAIVHGPTHICVLANAAFRALAGDTPIVGMRIDQLFPGVGRSDLLALLDRARADGSPVEGRLPIGVDGEPAGVDLDCIPLSVAGTASVLIVGRGPTAAGRLETWRSLPAAELIHRVNNTIAAARAVAERTARAAASVEEFLELLRGRLDALDQVQRLFAAGGWQKISGAALIRALLQPYALAGHRMLIDIDDLPLRSEAALTLALVIHELATNAARHGALSMPYGRVSVTGRLERDNGAEALGLTWQEDGGPPVRAPERSGFGTTMLSRAVTHEHGGQADLSWREEGLFYELRLPLS